MKIEVKEGRIQVANVYLDWPRHGDVIAIHATLTSKYPGHCGVAMNGLHIDVILQERINEYGSSETLYLDETQRLPTEIWISDLPDGTEPWDWRVFTDAARYRVDILLTRENRTQDMTRLWPGVS